MVMLISSGERFNIYFFPLGLNFSVHLSQICGYPHFNQSRMDLSTSVTTNIRWKDEFSNKSH